MKFIIARIIGFISIYIAQTALFWGAIEACTFFIGNNLKELLGSYWIGIYLIPIITSVGTLYFIRKKNDKVDEPEIEPLYTFDNVEFLIKFKKKKLKDEIIEYYDDCDDNFSIAIFPPNYILPSLFKVFSSKFKIPTPLYFAITNYRILYRHRFREKEEIKYIWLEDIEAYNGLKRELNWWNDQPQRIDIKTKHNKKLELYIGKRAGFDNDKRRIETIHNKLIATRKKVKPVPNKSTHVHRASKV